MNVWRESAKNFKTHSGIYSSSAIAQFSWLRYQVKTFKELRYFLREKSAFWVITEFLFKSHSAKYFFLITLRAIPTNFWVSHKSVVHPVISCSRIQLAHKTVNVDECGNLDQLSVVSTCVPRFLQAFDCWPMSSKLLQIICKIASLNLAVFLMVARQAIWPYISTNIAHYRCVCSFCKPMDRHVKKILAGNLLEAFNFESKKQKQ